MSKYYSISIFVPAYNEAGNLEGAVRDIVSAADEVFEDYEVLIVNDGSTDGTGEKAERLARENSRIQVIHNPGNLGFARCYQIALARAEKDHFIFLPGDHGIAAQSVREIFASVGRADVVVPYIQNHQARAWHRRVMSRVCVFLSNRVSGFKLKYYQGPRFIRLYTENGTPPAGILI